MIEGRAQKPFLKIIIQEEQCGQRVKQDMSVSLDRQHSRKTYSWGNVAIVKISTQWNKSSLHVQLYTRAKFTLITYLENKDLEQKINIFFVCEIFSITTCQCNQKPYQTLKVNLAEILEKRKNY